MTTKNKELLALHSATELDEAGDAAYHGYDKVENVAMRVDALCNAYMDGAEPLPGPLAPSREDIGNFFVFADNLRTTGEQLVRVADRVQESLNTLEEIRHESERANA